jgi:hypothetical protein
VASRRRAGRQLRHATTFESPGEWGREHFEGLENLEPYELEDVWLDAAASIVAPYVDPDIDPLPADIFGHGEWIAIAAGLNFDGPGTTVTPTSLWAYFAAMPDPPAADVDEVSAALVTLVAIPGGLGVGDAEATSLGMSTD